MSFKCLRYELHGILLTSCKQIFSIVKIQKKCCCKQTVLNLAFSKKYILFLVVSHFSSARRPVSEEGAVFPSPSPASFVPLLFPRDLSLLASAYSLSIYDYSIALSAFLNNFQHMSTLCSTGHLVASVLILTDIYFMFS